MRRVRRVVSTGEQVDRCDCSTIWRQADGRPERHFRTGPAEWRLHAVEHGTRLSTVIKVRRAGQGDLAVMLSVDPRAVSGDVERRDYLTDAVDRDTCFLAVVDDVACGFVVIKPRHFFGRDFVDLLMVSETHRQRGVGRALMRTAIEAASSADVFTSTNRSNTPMQTLLQSEGWSFSGKLDGLDDDDPELVYFARR